MDRSGVSRAAPQWLLLASLCRTPQRTFRWSDWPSTTASCGPLRAHFVRARVRVHRYPDDTLAVFHGPRCLARYRADGSLLEPVAAKAASAPQHCGHVDDPRAADRLRFRRVPEGNTGKCSPSPT